MRMVSCYPDLAGKVVVVIGGSRGIGARTARAFAAQGAHVAAVGRDEGALRQVVTSLEKDGGTAIGVTADVTDPESVDAMTAEVNERLGTAQVLAAFAGGQGFPVPTVEMTVQRWRQIIDSDLTSVFLTVQAFLPGMIDQRCGTILTMSSTAGRRPTPANLAYSAAKAGVVMFTRRLATELGAHGIRVNCLAPSTIRTEKVEQNMPLDQQRKAAAMHPLGRLGTTDDVAGTAVFLASSAASWLTGVTIDISGGWVTN
jgi:3-oxoacyl-[acyl-carrier protein] reductase